LLQLLEDARGGGVGGWGRGGYTEKQVRSKKRGTGKLDLGGPKALGLPVYSPRELGALQ
jgi:hypothetical protein